MAVGDAGFILFGPIGREVLSLGTILFAIAATVSSLSCCFLCTSALIRRVQGSELLSGQQALTTLSNAGLCAISLLAIFSAASFLLALPRTLDRLSGLGLISVVFIVVAGIVAMAGAGANPVPGRLIQAAVPQNFFVAFLSITNPVSSLQFNLQCFLTVL